jgi:hypothetical protein
MKGFLLDEHVSFVVQKRLGQEAPALVIYRVGDGSAPARGSPDERLLEWLEMNDCMLVTNNRASMPGHLSNHVAQGRHVLGIIQLPKRANLNQTVEELILIANAGRPGEFQDQIVYLPLRR